MLHKIPSQTKHKQMDLPGKVDHLIQLTTSLKGEICEEKSNDLNVRFDELERQTVGLRHELNDLRYSLTRQNSKIIALILQSSDQFDGESILLQNSLNMDCENEFDKVAQYANRFPVRNQDELDNLEKLINITNKDAIIATMRQLLSPGGIIKNINSILSTELLVEFHVNGKHKKKHLPVYQKFMDALFAAASKDGYTNRKFIEDLQYSFRMATNRQNTENMRKRRQNQSVELDEDDEYYDDDEECENDDIKDANDSECDDDSDNDGSSQADSVFKIVHLN